jgi:hypothetical protein
MRSDRSSARTAFPPQAAAEMPGMKHPLEAARPAIVPAARRGLKRLAAAALLGALQWLGDAFVTWSGWPVSGSVLGMLALLVLLCLRGGVPASLDAVTTPLLRRLALPLLGALLAGGLSAVLSTLVLARLLGAPREVALSLAPKSATMPIAMAAAERASGVPALAAMAVVATGVLGTLLCAPLLRRLRIQDERVHAFTLGLAAHAIGVARVLQARPETAAFAALAMSAKGVTTALVVAVLARWL